MYCCKPENENQMKKEKQTKHVDDKDELKQGISDHEKMFKVFKERYLYVYESMQK
jgi:hypothetical protein